MAVVQVIIRNNDRTSEGWGTDLGDTTRAGVWAAISRAAQVALDRMELPVRTPEPAWNPTVEPERESP
jgi:hypothetical protein